MENNNPGSRRTLMQDMTDEVALSVALDASFGVIEKQKSA